MRRVVVVNDTAITVPRGASEWEVARWYNPGILPDEFKTVELIEVTLSELRYEEDDEGQPDEAQEWYDYDPDC